MSIDSAMLRSPCGKSCLENSEAIPAKWSANQILSVIVVFVILAFKVCFVSFVPKGDKKLWTFHLQRSATEHSYTCHCIRCLHNLLNVLVKNVNKMGLETKVACNCYLHFKSPSCTETYITFRTQFCAVGLINKNVFPQKGIHSGHAI
jgi:hypothetical protein